MILIDLNCTKEDKLYSIYHENIEALNLIYVHISFNLSYINLINDKIKYNNVFKKVKLKFYINKLRKELIKIYSFNIGNNYNINNNESVIFSKEFLKLDNNENKKSIENIILDELYNILKKHIKLNVINKKDTFKDNVFKYLDKFNIDDKICIFDNNMIKKDLTVYIQKFKSVDIISLDENYKYNNKYSNKITEIIEKINNEYGTVIKYIYEYDLTKYDIAVINADIDITKYMFNKYVYKLNLIDSDYDIYSLESKMFNKYKENILNVDMFSKNKIGQVFIGLDR